MSGHNKWSQIKNRKGAQDAKKSLTFSKLLAAIAVAAKSNPKPDANPRLRSVIEKAKENNVPLENIERAINKAAEQKDLQEVLIEAITDNSNRTISEIRHLLDESGAKMATQGSVLWSFEKLNNEWKAKFPQAISDSAKQQLNELVKILEEHDDVQKVICAY